MVPTTELMRSKGGGRARTDTVNGSLNGAINGSTKAVINGSTNGVVNGSTKAVINGSTNGAVNGSTIAAVNGSPKVVVTGTSLVNGSNMSALVKTQKQMSARDDPFEEELKVLPSDEGFSWAKANYNSVQRSIDLVFCAFSSNTYFIRQCKMGLSRWILRGKSENPEEKHCFMVKRTSIAAWPNFYQAWTAILHKI